MAEDPVEHVLFLESIISGLRSEKKEPEALPFAEQALQLRLEVYGPAHADTMKACESYILMCNSIAMGALAAQKHEECYKLLKRAETLSHPEFGSMPQDADSHGRRLRARAITLNNLACYFRERGKLHAALLYLDEALHLELTFFSHFPLSPLPPADLMQCADESSLGEEGEGPKTARTASNSSSDLSVASSASSPKSGNSAAASQPRFRPNQQLASTYLNLAVVLSQLNRHDDALRHVCKAVGVLFGFDTVQVDSSFKFQQHHEQEQEQHQHPHQQSWAPQSSRTSALGSSHSNAPSFSSVLRLALPEIADIPVADDHSLVCATLYNLGVELEFCRRLVDAFVAYRLGAKYAERYLGMENPLSSQLLSSLGHLGQVLKIPVPKLSSTKQPPTSPPHILSRGSSVEANILQNQRVPSKSRTVPLVPAPPSTAGTVDPSQPSSFRRRRT
eukprot:ANDGO_05075.mRNA.1 hypothetical protein GUITHDRAFT_158222